MEVDWVWRGARGQGAKNPGHAPRCGGGWDRDPRAGPEARVARTPQPQNARLVPGHLGVGLTARLVWKDVVRVSAICRTARTHHREFAMGTGEMSSEALTAFLQTTLGHAAAFCRDVAIAFVCMDWRHMGELLAAGRAIFSELKNLCIWNKTNGGMGSFYRSMSDKALVLGKASPSGLATRSRLARTSLFVNAMRLSKPAAESPSGPNFRDGTSTQNRIRCGAVNRTLPVDGGRHGGASRVRFAPLTSSVANTGQLYPPESDAHPLGTPAQRGLHPLGSKGHAPQPHAGGIEHRIADGGGGRGAAISAAPHGGSSGGVAPD